MPAMLLCLEVGTTLASGPPHLAGAVDQAVAVLAVVAGAHLGGAVVAFDKAGHGANRDGRLGG